MSDSDMDQTEQAKNQTPEEIEEMLQSDDDEGAAQAALRAAAMTAPQDGTGGETESAGSGAGNGSGQNTGSLAATEVDGARGSTTVSPPPTPPPAPPAPLAATTAKEGPIVKKSKVSVSEINNKLKNVQVNVGNIASPEIDNDVFSNGTSPQAPAAPAQPADTGLPVHYSRIRAARENWQRVTVLSGPPGLNRKWAPALMQNPCGSFVIEGDTRHLSISNIHNMTDRCNISASFKTGTNDCLERTATHKILDSARNPVCISVTDQCFPPTVQAASEGKCIVTIRIEDARLDELAGSLDILLGRKERRDSIKLPAGSLILVGSLSHLHAVGTEQYALDLIRVVNELTVRVGSACHVIPALLVPLGGVHDQSLLRKMADLDSWICAAWPQPNLCLADTRAAIWTELRSAGVGGGLSCQRITITAAPN
jgi:hypothetical protein